MAETAGRHMRHGGGEARTLPRWSPVACLLAAAIIVTLVTIMQPPKYATPDDFMQHLYARGAYFDTPGLLMLYSLAPFSAPLCLLYALVPVVPWYPVVLLSLVAASTAVMLTVALRAARVTTLRAFLVVAVICCEVMACVYLSYTVVAFVTLAAGVALVVVHAGLSRPTSVRPSDVLGYALIVVGFSLRPESGLAAAAVFSPFLVWALVRNRNARTLAMAGGVVACMVACQLVGHLAWRLAEGWQPYDETFSAAQAVADWPRVSMDDVRRVAPQLSENDVDMVYEFLFVDADTYDLETFRALDGIVHRYGLATLLGAALARPAFTAFVALLALGLFAMAALVCRAHGLRGAAHALALSVPAMVSLLLLVVFLRARPKMHVILPLFVVGVYALVTCATMGPDERRPRQARPALPVAGMAAFVALAAFVEVKYALPLRRSLAAEITPAMQAYVDEHPDQLVAFTLSQGGLMNYDAFAFDRWVHPDNAVYLGGYEYYTAPWQTFLARTGLSRDGFLLNLLDGERMVTVGTEGQAELVRTYLEEHAGVDVSVEQVSSLGTGTQSDDEYAVWRFVPSGSSPAGMPDDASGEAVSSVERDGAVVIAEGAMSPS